MHGNNPIGLTGNLRKNGATSTRAEDASLRQQAAELPAAVVAHCPSGAAQRIRRHTGRHFRWSTFTLSDLEDPGGEGQIDKGST